VAQQFPTHHTTNHTELKTSEISVKAKPALRETIYAPYQHHPWFQPESDDSRPQRPARLDKFTRIPLRGDRRVAPLEVPVLADPELRAVHCVDLVSGGNLDDVEVMDRD